MSLITKKIHITWKTRDILQDKSVFIENCIGKLVNISPDWKPEVSNDEDVDSYLKENLDHSDYTLLKNDHPVSKTDFWRLLKMYNEGGLYTDIDRLCNISIDQVLNEETKFLLPICKEYDFSQDFMCSAPQNPIFLNALLLALSRRKNGVTNIYALGPQTYMNAVTQMFLGKSFDQGAPNSIFEEIRKMIRETGFIQTYREDPPYDTVLYRPTAHQVSFDHEIEKRAFYRKSNTKHWSGDW